MRTHIDNNVTNGKKEYFSEINIMRGLAVLCVVIGHSFDATKNPTILGFFHSFVYCFHMPVFFFISGFLVKKNYAGCEKIGAILQKMRRLLIPYFVLTAVTIVLKSIFSVFARNSLDNSNLVFNILIGKNNPNGGLWFLYALFVVSVIGILLSGIDKKVLFIFSVGLYLSNQYIFKRQGDGLGFFMIYSWFYFGGELIREYYNKLKVRLIDFLERPLVLFILYLIYMMVVYMKIYYECGMWVEMLIPWIGIFLLLMFALQIEKSTKIKSIINNIGSYGMDIYIIGYYVQQTVYVVLGKLLGVDYLIYAWCMVGFGIYAPILISKYIIRKNKWMSLLILGDGRI